MIGRVYRGAQVGGLLRYLYGPGRHNEHDDPHLVAAWDLETPAELLTLEPRVLAGAGARAMRDFGPMTGSLELATAFRPLTDKAAAKVVWHCPLRTAPGDRRLSDAEWAEVARDVMHRTGIAERGDDGGCRWVAVRHDEVSVHLVAVLARQDGQAVRIGNDYRHLREACRAAEQRLGLVGTAPADLTADRHTTRAEVEKAVRTGRAPDRDWLREQVQAAALLTTEPRAFLSRLRADGLVVRERTDHKGVLTGYAVGRPTMAGEKEVLFGGVKLAPDLSLPRLQARWQQRRAAMPESGQPAPVARRTGVAGELAAALAAEREPARRLVAVSHACAEATELLRHAVVHTARSDSDATADVVAAVGETFRAVSRLFDRQISSAPQRALVDMDRATRPVRRATVTTATPASQGLRRSTSRLLGADQVLLRAMRVSPELAQLLRQLQAVVEAVSDLRLAQQRPAQAAAASRSVTFLRRAEHEVQATVRPVGSAGPRARVPSTSLTSPSASRRR